MTIEELSRSLDKAEALINYKKTKEQTAVLIDQLAKNQTELSEYKNLKVTFAGKEVSLETFKEKAKEETLKVYGAEIQQRVDQILKTEDMWPNWFKQIADEQIQSGIKKSLNEAFSLKVQAAIHNAKTVEWPKFLEDYTRTRITPLCQQLIQKQLAKPITIQKACDKCGTVMTVSLSPFHIAELIRSPHIIVDCLNPGCRDLFLRHRLSITLGDVLNTIAETSQS